MSSQGYDYTLVSLRNQTNSLKKKLCVTSCFYTSEFYTNDKQILIEKMCTKVDSFSQRNRLGKLCSNDIFIQVSKSHLYSIRRRPLEHKIGKAHITVVHSWMVKWVILCIVLHPQILWEVWCIVLSLSMKSGSGKNIWFVLCTI